MRVLVLGCAIAAAALAQSGQPAGSISGRVVTRDGGAPVRGAYVLATQRLQEKGLAWTGLDGRFKIADLAPGMYQILAGKPARGRYYMAIEVRSGEETRDVVLAVTGPSVLAGRVRDADNLPVEGARVSLQRFSWLFGRPIPGAGGAASTNDRGEFRIAPRSSRQAFLALQPPARPDVAGRYRLLHPPLFYPNALNPAEAQPILAEPGVKVETIDFEVPPAAETTLRIEALAAQQGEVPRSCPRCLFSLYARNGAMWLAVLEGQSDGQGRIEIQGLQPGIYRVYLASGAAGQEYAGFADVFVDAGRVRTERVTAWVPNSALVRVTLVDPPAALLDAAKTWRARLEAGLLGPGYPAELEIGTAEIHGSGAGGRGGLRLAPGEWALRLYFEGARGAYIEQVATAGRPQRGPFVTVGRDGHVPSIEVRIGFAAAKLSGKALGLPELNLAEHQRRAFVIAVPDPPDGYGQGEEAPVMRGGQFEFQTLAPGGYLLFALPPGGTELQLDVADPAVQARYANYSKRVTVDPGGDHQVELQALP